MAFGPPFARRSARASHVASSSSSVARCVARPRAKPSAPLIVPPASNIARAGPAPIFFTSHGATTAGQIPRSTSGYPTFAASCTTAKSHTTMSPQPPPIAAPCTLAIVGIASLRIVSVTRPSARSMLPMTMGSSATARKSMPAQKLLPAPARISTRMLSSIAISASADSNSEITASESALRASGRLISSVTIAGFTA